jgi:phosphatidylserine decarboxylase
MRDPLESFPNLNAFFTRYLKDGARPIAAAEVVRSLRHADLRACRSRASLTALALRPRALQVSPVDGAVLSCGECSERNTFRVKVSDYTMPQLLGADVTPANPAKCAPRRRPTQPVS